MIAEMRTILVDGALRLRAVEDQRTPSLRNEQTGSYQSKERPRENRPYQLSHIKCCIIEGELIQS
jgi:hypothetical protein